MSYPQNPNTVLFSNRYYPKGFREIDTWSYYQSVKRELLKETVQRDLMFYLIVDGKEIILRKGTATKYLRLNPGNYDELITGRTISIHSTMKREDEIAIIDIDCDNWRLAKIATVDTFQFVAANLSFVPKVTIRYTGKTGFHVVCHMGRKTKTDGNRFLLRKFLSESDLAKKYTVEMKRVRGIPNLDLAPNKFRGGFITLHALSTMGLKCMEVDSSDVMKFDPSRARVKTS